VADAESFAAAMMHQLEQDRAPQLRDTGAGALQSQPERRAGSVHRQRSAGHDHHLQHAARVLTEPARLDVHQGLELRARRAIVGRQSLPDVLAEQRDQEWVARRFFGDAPAQAFLTVERCLA
jgi:hypothetical protein